MRTQNPPLHAVSTSTNTETDHEASIVTTTTTKTCEKKPLTKISVKWLLIVFVVTRMLSIPIPEPIFRFYFLFWFFAKFRSAKQPSIPTYYAFFFFLLSPFCFVFYLSEYHRLSANFRSWHGASRRARVHSRKLEMLQETFSLVTVRIYMYVHHLGPFIILWRKKSLEMGRSNGLLRVAIDFVARSRRRAAAKS